MSTFSENRKAMLAKLLASENISFKHDASAKTAYFDVKQRLLVLPLWQNISEDLYDLLVVHEVGHALDTPMKDWMHAVKNFTKKHFPNDGEKYDRAYQGFLNVVEDARIDKRQKRRYPGSKRNYVIGYKELITRDFFGTNGRNLDEMSFIDRANMFFKGGALLGIKFDQEEKGFLKRMYDIETFDEAVQLADEIFIWSKHKLEEQSMEQDLVFTENDGEGDEEIDLDDMFGDGDGDDEEGNGRARGRNRGENGSENSGNGFYGGRGQGDHIPKAETDEAWQRNLSKIVQDDDVNLIYVELPKANLDVIVDDYKTILADYAEGAKMDGISESVFTAVGVKARNEENAAISFLIKEFEMKKAADAYSKISIAKTGVLDTTKLHSYKYNDDLFRRNTVVPKGKNHGFVLFLDWSGSMTYNIKYTIKQLLSIVLFCRRLQIPFEVYSFRDSSHVEFTRGHAFSQGKNELRLENFKLRNLLSSRMKDNELNFAIGLLVSNTHLKRNRDYMGGTPLNEAIVAAESVVNNFRKKHKLQVVNTIFLTDGESDPMSSTLHRFSQGLPTKRKGNRYILIDKVGKREYDIGSVSNRERTDMFLDILKNRTNSNVVGFFLCSGAFKRAWDTATGFSAGMSEPSENKMKELQNLWSKEKFFPIANKGFDEYYVVDSTHMRNMDTNELNVSNDMTKNRIAKEFNRFAKKKSINRLLLRRFIERIAKDTKIVVGG